MEGKITWRDGQVTDFRTRQLDGRGYIIESYIPEWERWQNTLPDVVAPCPAFLLWRLLRHSQGVTSARFSDGEGPPLEVAERQPLPYWMSPPDNPEVPGLVESVKVVDGKQIAHIRE